MIARQAAQQGAANQQNAAGQAATMQANQSLNALGQAGTMANTMAQQQANATTANTQANQAQQNALLGAQEGYNTVQGQLANTQMKGQQGMLGGLMNAAGPMLQQGMQGIGNFFGPLVNGLGTMVGGSSGLAGGVGDIAGGVGDAIGGGSAADSLGSAALAVAAEGGEVKRMADGGDPTYGADSTPTDYSGDWRPSTIPASAGPTQAQQAIPIATNPTIASTVPKSRFGQIVNNQQKQQSQQPDYGDAGANALFKGASSLGKAFTPTTSSDQQQQQPQQPSDQPSQYAHGGKVPALVSPGEKYLSPSAVKKVKEGKNPMAVGETIPGKPKVGGAKNDYANDTVPKTLEEGGIVLPRSVTQAKNPHWEAMKFVRALQAKKSGRLS